MLGEVLAEAHVVGLGRPERNHDPGKPGMRQDDLPGLDRSILVPSSSPDLRFPCVGRRRSREKERERVI